MPAKPFILSIETSCRAGSVAIAAGPDLLAKADFSGPMRHSAELFPAIHSLLQGQRRKPKDIEHIYISVGPGSFTGIRIAVALAKAMNLANAVKIVAVDTLDVIAANATDYIRKHNTNIDKIAAVLDAKRGQFFIAAYQRKRKEPQATSNGIWRKLLPDSLMTATQFLDKFAGSEHPVWLLGEGLVYYQDQFKADGIRFLDKQFWSPRAVNVHLLGWQMAQAGHFADPATLTPAYLRRPQITPKQKSPRSRKNKSN